MVFPQECGPLYLHESFPNRVNKQGTHYTGALVGLGYDPSAGCAIYPDDDVELAFDFDFSEDDLILVSSFILL